MFGQRNRSMKTRGETAPAEQNPYPDQKENPKFMDALKSMGWKETSSSKKKKLEKQKAELEFDKKQLDIQKPAMETEADIANKAQANKNALESKKLRKEGREEGREDAKKFFSQDIEGLSPEKRSALQYEANKGIQRGVQGAHRKLLGEQGQRGIAGRSGVGYAQQKDLLRSGEQAKGQVHRDLDKLNSDLSMKKLAAMYAGGEGEASQSQLDKQMAIDEMNLAEEKRRQREFENQMYKMFSRV